MSSSRLTLGALVVLGVGCGGNAERNLATLGGSAGTATGGAGPTMGGGTSVGGVAGQGGMTAVGGSSGAGGGRWVCEGSTIVEHPEPASSMSTGFAGFIDGAQVALAAGDPQSFASEAGTLHATATICAGISYELRFYFGAPVEGESFSVLVHTSGDGCRVQGKYVRDAENLLVFGADVALSLDAWIPERGELPWPLVEGSFTADVRNHEGAHLRTIEGVFAVEAGWQFCI